MNIAHLIIDVLLPQSKAEAVTNAVAGASVTTVILPTWWPTQENISHNLAIIYLGVSILWIAVQIGFKFYHHFKGTSS